METKRRTLALIPARGGSKGLPRKNLRLLGGRPLITWTIEHALASRCVDRVVVSTDDPEIAEVAVANGAEAPFLRPASLATDTSPTIEAVRHALDWLHEEDGQTFDLLALLEPTSPLRAAGDVDRAIELLVDNEARADGVVSVGEVHLEHPSIVKRVDDAAYLRPRLGRRRECDTQTGPRRSVFSVRGRLRREGAGAAGEQELLPGQDASVLHSSDGRTTRSTTRSTSHAWKRSCDSG